MRANKSAVPVPCHRSSTYPVIIVTFISFSDLQPEQLPQIRPLDRTIIFLLAEVQDITVVGRGPWGGSRGRFRSRCRPSMIVLAVGGGVASDGSSSWAVSKSVTSLTWDVGIPPPFGIGILVNPTPACSGSMSRYGFSWPLIMSRAELPCSRRRRRRRDLSLPSLEGDGLGLLYRPS